uniref:C2 domain-containing protein n=1 Tax=Heterorhabditis bacteriophora TaxID=37862 RepID=A0A1I7XTV9_HETBA
MEQLNSMRNDYINNTYTIDRVPRGSYSRSNSRRSRVSENQSPLPAANNGNACSSEPTRSPIPQNATPLRERFSSNISTETDSVFEQPLVNRTNLDLYNKEDVTRERKCTLQLTVYEAMGLPQVKDERGCLVPPNAYISVHGRDGELRSPVCEQSRRPRWNWTGRFPISGERRNLVVKVIHQDLYSDVALGFVSLSIPTNRVKCADYELVDLITSGKSSEDTPIIKMSIEVLEVGSPFNVEINDPSARSVLGSRPSSRESHGSCLTNTKMHRKYSVQQRPSSPLITESLEEINDRLWYTIERYERTGEINEEDKTVIPIPTLTVNALNVIY